jgi:hypothetical protein
LEESYDLLRRWYAFAIQDEETRIAIQDFVQSYESFCAETPIQPHIVPGKMTPEYRNCLYLHNLYRRTELEDEKYLQYLEELSNCDYQEDVLKLATHLVTEYVCGERQSKGFLLGATDQKRLQRDAKRALQSLTREQKQYLYDTNAFDHVAALLAYLVQSKMMLYSVLRIPLSLTKDKCEKLNIAIVVPIHKEFARLKPLRETLSGEDFYSLKIKQLKYIVDDIPEIDSQDVPIDIRIGLVFCGDEESMCKELLSQARQKIQPTLLPSDSDNAPQTWDCHYPEDWLDVYVIYVDQSDKAISNTKSSNVKQGMQFALKKRYDVIGYTDADISTHLGQIGLLLHPILENRAAAAIASRRLPSSWVFGRDPARVHQSQVYNMLVRLFLGIEINDTQAGLKLFTAVAAKELIQNSFNDDTMAFDSELLAYLIAHDFTICEVPIAWFESLLESQSAARITALSMFQGVYQQSKASLMDTQPDSITILECNKDLQRQLISLGTNQEFYLLTSFCIRYYALIQPYYLRQFIDSLKTLFYALSRNELTAQEFQEFMRIFQNILERLPNSRGIDYILARYPELWKIVHAVWKDYKLLGPIMCFLLGSEFVAKVWPRPVPSIPSFYDFFQREAGLARGTEPRDSTLSRYYDLWLRCYRGEFAEISESTKPTRKAVATTERGRRASARKLLEDNKRHIGDKVLHLIVPAMTIANKPDWCDHAIWEIEHITEKIGALEDMYRGIRTKDKPLEFEFHFITGLTADMMPQSQEPTNPLIGPLGKLSNVIHKTGIGFSFYTLDGERTNEHTTVLIPYCFNAGQKIPTSVSPISIRHTHRNLKRELATLDKLKGTLLFMGFSAALQAVENSDKTEDSFIGYTVATMKIPLEEYVFLLDALLLSIEDGNSESVAVGSRRHSESDVANKPLLNHLRSAILNLIIRALFPDLATLSDSQASCKLFTPEMVKSIFKAQEEPFFYSSGPECDVEMLQLANFHEGHMIEVPISFYEGVGMAEGLGASVGLNLISNLLELKGLTPNVNQRPERTEHDGVQFDIQYIGSGTEHMVFKFEHADTSSKPPLIVKIPHEAIDTEFFLPIDSLCSNRLRLSGLSKITTRTDPRGLVTNNAIFRRVLSSGNPLLTNWIAYLRNWNEFNTVILKIIRAYEGKTYKSSGYRNGLGVHRFVVPFRMLSENESIVLRWNAGAGKRDYRFDGHDHVIVMDFVEDNIERFLRRSCENIPQHKKSTQKQQEIAELFKTSVRTAYDFSVQMAQEAKLYDLDMNMWADIGVLPADQPGTHRVTLTTKALRLLDPGELETLSTKVGRERCIAIIWERLRDMGDPESTSASDLLEKLDERISEYSDELFDAFQFKQLDILMDQYGLSETFKADVHQTCIAKMRHYLSALLEICAQEQPASPHPTEQQKEYWCIFKNSSLMESEAERFRRQISAIMLGGDVQGKFSAFTLEDFGVYASRRGISIRPTGTTGAELKRPTLTDKSKDERCGTLLVGREDVMLVGKELDGEHDCPYRFPQDRNGIPYRGAIATAINVLFPPGVQEELLTRTVVLDAGVASRMSMISYMEETKGAISLDRAPLREQAIQKYGMISRQTGRDDLIVFGAADTRIDVGADSEFWKKLGEYFAIQDRVSGRKAGVFFFQPPYDESKHTPVIPRSRNEQERWILNFLPEYLNDMQPFVPFLHLFEHQRSRLEGVDEIGYGFWYREQIPGESEGVGTALPALDYLTEFFRYVLISNAIRHHGGLRLPFLFILSTSVVEALYQEFFSMLDAPSAEKLDWYNTIVLGFSSIGEREFVKTHKSYLNHRQAQRLYKLLQKLKRESWSETHQREAQVISELFYKEVEENRIQWYAFESPVDIFNYHRASTEARKELKNGHVVEIYSDSTLDTNNIQLDMSNVENIGSPKTFTIVVSGKVPACGFEIKLELPSTDIAKRSNFYPYLVYCATTHELEDIPPIQISAHELCIIDSIFPNRPLTVKLPFVQLSKDATLKTEMVISMGIDEKWEPMITTTVANVLQRSRGRKQLALYNLVYAEVQRLIDRVPAEKGVFPHMCNVEEWATRLFESRHMRGAAPIFLKVAALLHDIDRAYPLREIHGEDFTDYEEYKREHSLESARIASDFLMQHDAGLDFIMRVACLIANHEYGGDTLSDIIVDADSISFFEDNFAGYLRVTTKEKTKKKVKFMYDRMSPEAKDIVRREIDFDKTQQSIIDDVVNSEERSGI